MEPTPMSDEIGEDKRARRPPSTARVLIPGAIGIISILSLFHFAWVFASREFNESFALSASILLAAISSGWVVGIFTSPLNSGEKAEFSQYAKALTAFVSGFLIAKLSETVTHILSPEYVLTPLGGFRIISFATGFIVALLLMFGWRRYWNLTGA